MKKVSLLTVTLMMLTLACAKIDVPSSIGVHGETTIRVVHSVEVSLEVKEAYEQQCRDELGPTATLAEIDNCKNGRIASYVEGFLNALNAALAQQTPTPTPQP